MVANSLLCGASSGQGRAIITLPERYTCVVQVEYHYFGPSNFTDPSRMLAVLQGLAARYLRVFSVEPNYWWTNRGHDFIEFAYLQVRARHIFSALLTVAGVHDAVTLSEGLCTHINWHLRPSFSCLTSSIMHTHKLLHCTIITLSSYPKLGQQSREFCPDGLSNLVSAI